MPTAFSIAFFVYYWSTLSPIQVVAGPPAMLY
jgi:hypothetical protein